MSAFIAPASRILLSLLVSATVSPFAGSAAVPAFAGAPACAAATPAAVADFFDHAVPGQLSHDGVPGAVVSVVSGGTTVFAHGYGLSDAERGIPMDARRSLVRVGSITKLFTWTAVMQQVQAGRLDLDTDVNRYLKDFQIPATYPQPVTLQNLMDHTAGFEDQYIDTGARTAADVPPLGQYLARHIPARIRPPGEISAYSNFGAALAGYIVAQVSGEPYDQYVQHHLLDPLGMTRSTATEPVPAALAADLAHSYDAGVHPPRRIPFIFDPMAPDGSISTTAGDLANFMIAQLRSGRFGAAEILSPASMTRMHQQSFAPDPRLDGYAHGFKERTINGHRVLMHDGGWEGFVSGLLLVPECDLGLFVSANATGPESLSQLIPQFFDRFAPASAASQEAGSASAAATSPTPGFYQPTRHTESTVEKVETLLGPRRLTVAADGTVTFLGKTWTPQGAGLYRATEGTDRLVFLAAGGGRRYVATDNVSYQLLAPTDTLPVNLWILLAFLLPALSALALPVAWVVRRITNRRVTTSRRWRIARTLAAGSAALGVVFAAGLTAVLLGNTDDYLFGVPVSFRLLLCLPIVVLATAIAATICTVTAWRRAEAGTVARIHQVALLAGLAAFGWFLWHWNLIGWNFS
jgi:CubicO group peptidase (beta-lactamase class C family)